MSDTFDKIIRTGETTGGQTGGGGGDVGNAFLIENNLSEGTPATMLTNLGLTATATELNRLDGSLSTVQGNLGLKDGSADLDLNSLTLTDLGTSGAILFSNASGKITETSGLLWDGITFDVGADVAITTGHTLSIGASTVNETELGILEGATLTTAELNQLDGNVFTSGITGTTADFSGAVEVNSLDIGTTGHGFDSSGNVSGNLGDYSARVTITEAGEALRLDSGAESNVEMFFYHNGSARYRLGTLGGDGNSLRLRDENVGSLLTFDSSGFAELPQGVTSIRRSSESNGANAQLRFGVNTSAIYKAGIYFERATGVTNGRGDLFFAVDPSDDGSNVSAANEVMRIKSTGIEVTGTGTFSGDLTAEANLIVDLESTLTGDVTLGADLLMNNASALESDAGFTSGFTGSGVQLARVDSLWRLELDDAFIRGSLFANEFIINQISAVNGSDILSPGRGKVEEITGTAPDETITVSDPQGGNFASFVADDIVIIQQVRPNDNQIVKRIVRQVASVSGNDVTLESTSGAPSDSGSIESGDIIVAIGNISDADRQSNIYRTVTETNSPYVRINDGITSWSDWTGTAKTVLQYGQLQSITSADEIGFLTGDYSGGSYMKATASGIDIVGGNLDVTSLPRVDDTGLQSLFRFQNSFIDGQGLKEVTVNSAPTITEGIGGNFAVFDGTDDYIDLDSAYSLGNGTNFSVSFYAYFDAFSADDGLILGDDANQDWLRVNQTQTTIRIGGDVYNLDHFSLSTDTVYHIVLRTLTGGTNLTLFIDKVEQDSVDISTSGNWEPSRIGGEATRRMDGGIANLRVYNRGLLESDIKSLFNYPSGNSGGLTSTDNLVVTSNALINDLLAETAEITNTLTIGTGGSFESDVITFSPSAFEINNTADTLFIDDSTLVLGTDASTQALKGAFDSGVYANTSGHFRAGGITGAGILNKGILWDGTNALFEGNNLSVTASGATFSGELSAVTGSFGAVDISGVLTMGAGGEITNSGDTLFIDDSTFVLGTDADGQALKGSFDAGVYANVSGHFRAGSMGSTTLNKGIIWDGTDFEMSDANIIGTLEMGTNGEITNSGGDYSITDDGMSVQASVSFDAIKAFSVKDGATVVGGLWGSSSNINLQGDIGDVNILAFDRILLSGDVVQIGASNSDIGFFGTTPASQQVLTESTTNAAITEIQNILIAYGLAEDNIP